MKHLLFLAFFPILCRASDLPLNKEFSTQAWQSAVEKVFYSSFSDDKEVIGNTVISVLDASRVIARTNLLGEADSARVIILSHGFINFLESDEELLFFLAHEVGHSKMDILGFGCDMCGGKDCEETAADRFAIDFLESRGYTACAGKTLLLKLMLEAAADVESNRLQQLREHCLSKAAE